MAGPAYAALIATGSKLALASGAPEAEGSLCCASTGPLLGASAVVLQLVKPLVAEISRVPLPAGFRPSTYASTPGELVADIPSTPNTVCTVV